MRVEQQAIAQLQRVELRQAAGQLRVVGQAAGGEQVVQAAFAQLVGAGGHFGGTAKALAGMAAGLPRGHGGLCRLIQGHRFGRDLLLRCRLPSRCTIGHGQRGIAARPAGGAGQRNADIGADDALLAGPFA